MAPFSTLLADGVGRLVLGPAAECPFNNGDLVECLGVFDNGDSAGSMVGVITSSCVERHTYKVRVLWAEDEYFRWQLLENPETPKNPKFEPITSWKVLNDIEEVENFPEDMVPRIRSDIKFIKEMLSSEAPPKEVKNDKVPIRNCVFCFNLSVRV
jgi:hypothetical protein